VIIFLGFPHGHGFSTSGSTASRLRGFSGAFDCLSSTLSAARKVGFQLVATATIASTRALAVWPSWGCVKKTYSLLVGMTWYDYGTKSHKVVIEPLSLWLIMVVYRLKVT
jgi:hypothetical protein